MHLLVAIGDHIVEFLAHQLALVDVDQPAEPTAHSVDHQPEVVLILLPNYLLRRPLQLSPEELLLVLQVATAAVPDDRSDGESLGGVVLMDANFFHEFGSVFYDNFGVVLETGGGDEVHGIEYCCVKDKKLFFLGFDVLAIILIELVHAGHYLRPGALHVFEKGSLFDDLLPELHLELDYGIDLGDYMKAMVVILQGVDVFQLIRIRTVFVVQEFPDLGLAPQLGNSCEEAKGVPADDIIQRIVHLLVGKQLVDIQLN